MNRCMWVLDAFNKKQCSHLIKLEKIGKTIYCYKHESFYRKLKEKGKI